ncbi:MAG: hypothetical protein ACK5GJ_18295 [Planctomycetota bacterium]
MRSFLVLGLICLFSGCAPKVEMLGEPVSVSGKLTKSGQPLGNVTLMLQPLEKGHPVPLKVGADGSYKGSVVPGKYAYFLMPLDEANAAVLNGVDASLKEANMQRTITVAPGQSSLNVEL